MECIYCAASLTSASARDHYQRLHPERIQAARTYRAALEAGKPEDEARALANAIIRKAVETNAGKYTRGAMPTMDWA